MADITYPAGNIPSYPTLAQFPVSASAGALATAQDTDSIYIYDLTSNTWLLAASGGSSTGVTSVAMTVPSFLAVSGSPITTSGTLAVTLNTEASATVFAGPTTGSAATPTFRSLAATDIPNIAESQVTNLVSDLAGKQATGNYITALTGDVSASGPGSVAATINSVGGSSAALVHSAEQKVNNTESANIVFAGPASGGAAAPTYRALVAADLPDLSGTYVPQTEVGANNGVASLDSSGKVPLTQLPSTLLEYKGQWNPSTNTPLLVDGTGVSGYVYIVSTTFAGPVVGLSNPTMVNFQVGNLVLYNGVQWEQAASATGVTSVNGAVGAVTVNAINQLTGDVTTSAASGSQSEAATIAANAVTNAKLAQAPANTLKGNNTGSTANEADLTVSQVQTMLAIPVVSGFTAGSIPFSNGTTLTEDNTNLFYDSTNKSLSVGPGPHPATSADLAISSQAGDTKVALSVFTTSTNNAVQINNQSGFSLAAQVASNTNSPSINFERARGTLAAKTQALAGDILGSFVFNGYTGSADGAFAAAFGAVATENQASGHAGASLIFQTTPNASSTLVPRVAINQDGTVTVYGLTASRALATDSSSNLAVSATTSTELGYVSGVTSAIQTQLNGKQATGNYITALTGDVSASGPGSAATTILSNVVSNAKLAQMPTLTIKGNNTGGTANALDLTVSQVQAMLGLTTGLWQTYTPTVTGFGTVTNLKGTYKQVGDSLKLKIFFTAGTVAASLASVTLPGGFALSTDTTNKIPLSNTSSASGLKVGSYASNSASGTNFGTWLGAVVTAPATSTTLVYCGLSVTDRGNKLIPANGNAISETSSDFSLECEVILA